MLSLLTWCWGDWRYRYLSSSWLLIWFWRLPHQARGREHNDHSWHNLTTQTLQMTWLFFSTTTSARTGLKFNLNKQKQTSLPGYQWQLLINSSNKLSPLSPRKCSLQTRWHRLWHQVKYWQGENAFSMHKNIWASKNKRITTKLQILHSNVRSIVLFGAETWRNTKISLQRNQTFYNTCLRHIFYVNITFFIFL